MTSQSKTALAVVVSLGLYLVITSTFFPLDFLGVFNAKRVLQLCLFAAIMIFAVAWGPLRMATVAQLSRLSKLNRYLLALFFSIGIISSLRLEHPAYALVDVSMMFVMMILIAVTAASRELSGERFDKWAVVLLAAMGFAVAVQEFMGFVAGWVIGSEFSYDQALIHFAHPRFYNQLQTWSIPVLAALPLLFPGKRWIKAGCVVLIGLQWFLVIALAARGTVVSLLIAMSFIALWLPAQRKFWLKFQLGGLIVGVAIYGGILFLNGALIPQSKTGEFYTHSAGRPMMHTSGRSTLWRYSIDDAVKHPILGSGPTRYACDSNVEFAAHPHSFPLTILGEWGMIAFALFLIFGITIGITFLKNIKWQNAANQTDPRFKATLATSLIAGFIHSGLSGVMIMPASQTTMILIAGWALSLASKTRVKASNLIISNTPIFVAALLALMTVVFAISEIKQISDTSKQFDAKQPMAPRFWQDGKTCGEKRGPSFE